MGFGVIPKNEAIQKKFAQWKWKAHQGIDFACPEGTEVLATDAGKVILARINGDYGNCVILGHRWGTSLYAHLRELRVLIGQSVIRGELIGLSGKTGATFGAHLHFGIKIGFGFVDPLPFFLPNNPVVDNPVVGNSKTKNTQKQKEGAILVTKNLGAKTDNK